MTDGTPAEVLELQRALESAARDAQSSRFLAQLALCLAVLVGCAAWWVDGRSASRARAIATEVETLRMALHAARKTARDPVERLRPETVESSAPSTGASDDPDEARERKQLRDRVDALQARTAEVEGGFVAWGTETKSYVDATSTRITEEQRQERAVELRTLLERITALEARVR